MDDTNRPTKPILGVRSRNGSNHILSMTGSRPLTRNVLERPGISSGIRPQNRVGTLKPIGAYRPKV